MMTVKQALSLIASDEQKGYQEAADALFKMESMNAAMIIMLEKCVEEIKFQFVSGKPDAIQLMASDVWPEVAKYNKVIIEARAIIAVAKQMAE